MRMTSMATMLVLGLAGQSALAQTVPGAPVISAAAADAAILACNAWGTREKLKFSIAVVNPSGELVAFRRMDGAGLLSVDVAQRKARSAALFGRSTADLGAIPNIGNFSIPMDLLTLPGGVPVSVGGAVVGAVGVSGAAPDQDRQCAEAAAKAVAGG